MSADYLRTIEDEWINSEINNAAANSSQVDISHNASGDTGIGASYCSFSSPN